MGKRPVSARALLYLVMAAVYLFWCFTGNPRLQLLFAALLLVAVIFAVPRCNQRNKLMGLVLFGLGIICLLFSDQDWQSWSIAISSNGGLVVLFIALPLFSLLLSFNDYLAGVKKLFHNYVHNSSGFFFLTSLLAGLIGAVMNMGGITLMYELLHPNLESYGDERRFAQALSRGNLSMSYWAPCHMSVATVITYTGITWLELVPRGVFLSILQLGLIGIFFYLARLQEGENAVKGKAEIDDDLALTGRDKSVLTELLAVYLGLIAWVAFLNWRTSLPILAIITVSAYTYPLFVGLLLRKSNIVKNGWQDYVQNKLPNIVNQVTLFSSVGFFGKSLELSGFGDRLIRLIGLDQIGLPVLLVAGIAFVMIIVSMIGVHPIVSMIALATTLKPELLGISALTLAYTYLLGYSVGVIVSPFSAVALVMSGLNGQDPWNGMSRHNLLYGTVLVLLFSLIIVVIT